MTGDNDFEARRAAARGAVQDMLASTDGSLPDGATWFDRIYQQAGDDPAGVPWADLEPKSRLLEWLSEHPGDGLTAIDVACGLGDNAEALAEAGYTTSAFDLVDDAVQWAKRRFPVTSVDYRVNDLFDLPEHWQGAFDLVHECYTLQALQGELREKGFAAIANLVRQGGTLLMITRVAAEGMNLDGPPWPLTPSEIARLDALALGLERISDQSYETERHGKIVPHKLISFRKA